jgi:hypothetical protein
LEKNGLGEETTRSYCSLAGYVFLRVLLSREAMLDHVSVAGRSFSFRDGVESTFLLNAPLIKVMQSGKLPWRQFTEFQGSAWATQPRHGPKSQRFQHYVPHSIHLGPIPGVVAPGLRATIFGLQSRLWKTLSVKKCEPRTRKHHFVCKYSRLFKLAVSVGVFKPYDAVRRVFNLFWYFERWIRRSR